MRTTIFYVFLTALRDRLFVGLCVGVVAIVGLAALLGGTSLIEHAQVSIVFTAAACRVLLVVGLTVFVCFHLRHAFDAKEVDVLLSRPISRMRVVLAYWAGFSLVATLLALPVMAAVTVPGVLQVEGYGLWSASLLLELWLVVALALFAGFMLKSAVSAVMTCAGFYVLARMSGLLMMTSESKMLFGDQGVNTVLEYVMKGVTMLFPRLDLFGKGEWLVYGVMRADALWLCVTQAVVYIPLLLIATAIDFRRREF